MENIEEIFNDKIIIELSNYSEKKDFKNFKERFIEHFLKVRPMFVEKGIHYICLNMYMFFEPIFNIDENDSRRLFFEKLYSETQKIELKENIDDLIFNLERFKIEFENYKEHNS